MTAAVVAASLARAARAATSRRDIPAPQPRGTPSRMGNLTIALLLLVTAAAAGAVVYFGLPYVQ